MEYITWKSEQGYEKDLAIHWSGPFWLVWDGPQEASEDLTMMRVKIVKRLA